MSFADGLPDIAEHLDGLKVALDALPLDDVERVVWTLYGAYVNDSKIFIIGNGGSASTASHMACDLIKATMGHKRMRAIALTDNSAVLTALGNDLGYERIFAEQLQALAGPGDLLIAITGSGESLSVLEAVVTARLLGVQTIGLLGFGGGTVMNMLDQHVLVASSSYEHVEDIHLILNHVIASSLRAMLRTNVE